MINLNSLLMIVRRDGLIYTILRLFFAGLLLFAAYDKVLHPTAFAQSIENYRMLGPTASRWLAIWIPYLEAILGVCLIVGFWPKETSYLNALLMAVFLTAVAQGYFRGLDINCGCFAAESGSKLSLGKLMQNVLLFLLSIGLIVLNRTSPAISLSHTVAQEPPK
ncbi:MAG: MauE/DoxX family redox-associated membrane protein [Calditrichia bacterium]